jgi:hypothetical protein
MQAPGGLSREALENREVLLDLLSRPRTTNLDDHLGAVVQPCGVHLPDRRRGKWMQVQPSECVGPELLLDGALDDRGRDRRCRVLQLGELCSIGR